MYPRVLIEDQSLTIYFYQQLDSDEWDECRIQESDSLIKPRDCLFCVHHSKNMVKNLKHMSEAHSFFIPDVEFCINIRGLLLYLGEKVKYKIVIRVFFNKLLANLKAFFTLS